jgi:lysozyme
MNIERVCKYIAGNEGFSPVVYLCSSGRRTIGFGHNIDVSPLPVGEKLPINRAVARHMLQERVTTLLHRLSQHMVFQKQTDARKCVILDMAYQMGADGAMKFHKMLAALDNGEWQVAVKELMDSKYARQTPNRASRNAKAILTGEWPKNG